MQFSVRDDVKVSDRNRDSLALERTGIGWDVDSQGHRTLIIRDRGDSADRTQNQRILLTLCTGDR